MRTKSKHLLFSSALAIGACTAGDVVDAPGRSNDAATASDGGQGATARSDAATSANQATDAAAHDDGDTAMPTADAGPHTAADAGGAHGGNPADDAGVVTATGETGRMVGMTAAHNAVRAMVQTTPELSDLVWDPTLAAFAQQWADLLAAKQSTCDNPMHRSGAALTQANYGENLAIFGSRPYSATAPQKAVDGWASEIKCWTFGSFAGTDKCDLSCAVPPPISSDGCGHYTQVVWRKSTKLGCGVASCASSMGYQSDIWICNYSPAGNVRGQTPY